MSHGDATDRIDLWLAPAASSPEAARPHSSGAAGERNNIIIIVALVIGRTTSSTHTHVTRSLYLHPHQFVCLEQVKLPPFAAAAAEQQATRNKRDERQLLGANSNTIKLASREQSASRLYQRAGKSESEIHVKGLPGIDAPLYLIAAAHPPSPIRSDSRWRRREEEEFFAQLYWRAAT